MLDRAVKMVITKHAIHEARLAERRETRRAGRTRVFQGFDTDKRERTCSLKGARIGLLVSKRQ